MYICISRLRSLLTDRYFVSALCGAIYLTFLSTLGISHLLIEYLNSQYNSRSFLHISLLEMLFKCFCLFVSIFFPLWKNPKWRIFVLKSFFNVMMFQSNFLFLLACSYLCVQWLNTLINGTLNLKITSNKENTTISKMYFFWQVSY